MPFLSKVTNACSYYRYTAKNSTVYAILLSWPPKQSLQLPSPKTSTATKVSLMPLYFDFAFPSLSST